MNKKYISLLVISSLLVGCANMKKEEIGTLAGTLGGAAIGSKIDGTRGAIIGAILAGIIGNRIGSYLDEQDRVKLAELELKSLDTNKEESFVTSKSNAKVTVTPQDTQLEPKKQFVLSSSLQEHPLVDISSSSINAYVDTPIYSDIDEKSKPKMIIQKGVSFSIPAEVQGKNWVVVGDNDVGIGYVPKRYLKPDVVEDLAKQNPKNSKLAKSTSTIKTKKTTTSTKKIATETVAKVEKNSVDNVQVSTIKTTNSQDYQKEVATLNEKSKAANYQAVAKNSTHSDELRVVQIARECKVITRKVDTGSSSDSFSENVKYCKEPPKGWQTQAV